MTNKLSKTRKFLISEGFQGEKLAKEMERIMNYKSMITSYQRPRSKRRYYSR